MKGAAQAGGPTKDSFGILGDKPLHELGLEDFYKENRKVPMRHLSYQRHEEFKQWAKK